MLRFSVRSNLDYDITFLCSLSCYTVQPSFAVVLRRWRWWVGCVIMLIGWSG